MKHFVYINIIYFSFNQFSICNQSPASTLALIPWTNALFSPVIVPHRPADCITRHKAFSAHADLETPEQANPPLRSLIGSAVLLWIKNLYEHPLQSVLSYHCSCMSLPPFSGPNIPQLNFKFCRNEIFYCTPQFSRCQNNAACFRKISLPKRYLLIP